MSRFDDAGFVEINDLNEIYEAIIQLDEELKLRGADKTRRHMLIVAVDELGRILKDEPRSLDVMETLRQAAVEGRKFNVIVLVSNHSQTTKAIDMDSQYRDAFYQMFLVGAAVQKLNMPNAPALKKVEEEWIRTAPYPVLTCINGRYQACQHPTHFSYQQYQDSGNPPVGLIELPQNTVHLGRNIYNPSAQNDENETQESEETDIEQIILQYLGRSRRRSPKSSRQMKQNCGSLQAWTEAEIEVACQELVEAEELIYSENEGFYLSD